MAAPSPGAHPRVPDWITLPEAGFVTGLSQAELRARVRDGRVRSDPALVQRLGPRFLMVRTEDLAGEGLIPDAPATFPASQSTDQATNLPSPPPTPAPSLGELVPRIRHDEGRPLFVNDDGSWPDPTHS